MFEIVTPTVVFKYCEDTASPGAVVAPYAGMVVEDDSGGKDAVYFDALNTWVSLTACLPYDGLPLACQFALSFLSACFACFPPCIQPFYLPVILRDSNQH